MMADNRFRNSKAYYDEHKEELKAKMTVPMRQIAGILGEELLSLDPFMNTVPTKMVSRIRRDTRYTKDKSLYRENMWIMFMRDKHQWRGYPCMWFEVTPTAYSYGVGFFGDEPGLMAEFRKHLRENSEVISSMYREEMIICTASTRSQMSLKRFMVWEICQIRTHGKA